jgi:hypothetical protein
VLRFALVSVLAVGCSFTGAHDPVGTGDGPAGFDAVVGDDGPGGDGPGDDAAVPDAAVPIPDAAPAVCPTTLPAGCTGALFQCGASAQCYAMCTGPGADQATAESRCIGWGGHLASLSTAAEQECMAAVATGSGDFWVGVRQIGGTTPTQGWTYLDGTAYPGVTNWHAGQPDDFQGTENGDEDCADLEIGWTWEWNDEDCDDVQSYVCERAP